MRKTLTISAFTGFPIIAVAANHDVVSPILGLLWIFMILPVCILYLIDWFRNNEHQTKLSRIGKTILRFPIALLGLISIILGLAIIIWIFYNTFVERQNGYTGPSFILGGFGIGPSLVAVGFYWVFQAFRKKA